MQHILDDYWEVSTTTVDLGPIPQEVLEDFWKGLIEEVEEVGDDLDGLD